MQLKMSGKRAPLRGKSFNGPGRPAAKDLEIGWRASPSRPMRLPLPRGSGPALTPSAVQNSFDGKWK
jgi:hypothetical protein